MSVHFIYFILIYLFILYRAVLKTTFVRTHPVLRLLLLLLLLLLFIIVIIYY